MSKQVVYEAEWLELILEAKNLGLSIGEVRDFIQQNQNQND
ncbi:anti-repressor SinI family protein [Peribacillus sp. NPDC096379]